MKTKRIENILFEIQKLEDIGGPDRAEYIEILEAVKADIEKRLESANTVSNSSVSRIMDLIDESGIQIVSYGLSPNPNGFCFEGSDDTTDEQMNEMANLIEDLSFKDEKKLRRIIFGGGSDEQY